MRQLLLLFVVLLVSCVLFAGPAAAANASTFQELTDAINGTDSTITIINDITFVRGIEIKRPVTITDNGKGYTLNKSKNIDFFTVNQGGALTLNGSLTLDGTGFSGSRGVSVSGGTFTMHGGNITGNVIGGSGGGVSVNNKGTFTMHGGNITGNKVSGSGIGGGVYVGSNGSFTMHGGNITGNSVTADNGGGVYVGSNGSFTMHGGNITGNSADNGGGVFVYGGTFTMHGGNITGNKVGGNGGGVHVYSTGTFDMSGGNITGNTASEAGGGVSVSGGKFIMSDGKISGNIASETGGGVHVYSTGTFDMSGGEISGNTANYGGGVYVYDGGKFIMSDGNITGNSANNGGGVYFYTDTGTFDMSGGSISGNTATTNNGGGVYIDRGTFNVTGTATVAGDNAVHLLSGKTITVTGSYTGTIRNITLADPFSGAVVTCTNGVTASEIRHRFILTSMEGQTKTLIPDSTNKLLILGTASDGLTITQPVNPVAPTVAVQWTFIGALPSDTTINTYLSGGTGAVVTGSTGVGESGTVHNYQTTVTGLQPGTTYTLTIEYGVHRDTISFTPTAAPVVTDHAGLTRMLADPNVPVIIIGKDIAITGVHTVNRLVTITDNGEGYTLTRSSNNGNYAFFSVTAGGDLTLKGNLTLKGEVTSSPINARGVYVSGGSFTMDGGNITGNKVSGSGGGVYVDGGTFTMYGGNITGNTATQEGGGVFITGSGSTFTMDGGEISGNTANNNGGSGVYVNNGGSFIMNGGSISGNSDTTNNGCGVYVGSSGTFTMHGGNITGNTAKNYGGGVYVTGGSFTMHGGEISGNEAKYGGGVSVGSSGGIFNVLGTATVAGDNAVYLPSGKTITVTGEYKGAIRNITLGSSIAGTSVVTVSDDAIAQGVTASKIRHCFILTSPAGNTAGNTLIPDSTNKLLILGTASEGLTITPPVNPVAPTVAVQWTFIGDLPSDTTINTHLSGGTGAVVTGSTGVGESGTVHNYQTTVTGLQPGTTYTLTIEYGVHSDTISFTPTAAPVVTDHAGLARMLADPNVPVIIIGKDIAITAGGHTVNRLVTITDNGEGYTLTRSDTNGNYPFFSVTAGGDLTLEGNLTLKGEVTAAQANARGVYVINGGNFTMYGGNITGNKATGTSNSDGGGVYVNNGGTFTMYGGSITRNTATSNGGGVYVGSSGTFTMHGGIISGNNATNGGGVYVGSGGTFTMHGGIISGNNAKSGGGVFVSGTGSTFTMHGGNITRNTATSYGGGVYVNGGSTFTMHGGNITGNTATSYGGGVYVYTNGSFNVLGTATVAGDNTVHLAKNTPITVTGSYTGTIRNISLLSPYTGAVVTVSDDAIAQGVTAANIQPLFTLNDKNSFLVANNNNLVIDTDDTQGIIITPPVNPVAPTVVVTWIFTGPVESLGVFEPLFKLTGGDGEGIVSGGQSKIDETSKTRTFTTTLTNLQPGTQYKLNITYGKYENSSEFKTAESIVTKLNAPELMSGTLTETSAAFNIRVDNATKSLGDVHLLYSKTNDQYNATLVTALLGQNQGGTTLVYQASIAGLTPDTTYYIWSYAPGLGYIPYGNGGTIKTLSSEIKIDTRFSTITAGTKTTLLTNKDRGSDLEWEWESNNRDVIGINTYTGVITAYQEGKAKITLKGYKDDTLVKTTSLTINVEPEGSVYAGNAETNATATRTGSSTKLIKVPEFTRGQSVNYINSCPLDDTIIVKVKVDGSDTSLTADVDYKVVDNVILIKNPIEGKEYTAEFIGRRLGDVNGDSRVDSMDATLIMRYAVELINFDQKQIVYGDVTGDRGVTATDALRIMEISGGICDKNFDYYFDYYSL